MAVEREREACARFADVRDGKASVVHLLLHVAFDRSDDCDKRDVSWVREGGYPNPSPPLPPAPSSSLAKPKLTHSPWSVEIKAHYIQSCHNFLACSSARLDS